MTSPCRSLKVVVTKCIVPKSHLAIPWPRRNIDVYARLWATTRPTWLSESVPTPPNPVKSLSHEHDKTSSTFSVRYTMQNMSERDG
jgi:hypothetical protein